MLNQNFLYLLRYSFSAYFFLFLFLLGNAQKNQTNENISLDSLVILQNQYLLTNPDSVIKLTNFHFQFINKQKNYNLTCFSRVLNNLGIAYHTLGKNQKALECLFMALRFSINTNDSTIQAYSLDNIGIVLQNLNFFEKALPYQLRALELEKALNDKYGIASSLINIGNTYQELGNDSIALLYFENAFLQGKEIKNEIIQAYALDNIGNIYAEQGKLQKALQNKLTALQIEEKHNDVYGIITSMITIGNVYYKMHDINNAVFYYNKGIALANPIDGLIYLYENISGIAECHAKIGNFKDAYLMRTRQIELKDSIDIENNQKIMLELKEKYESDLRQKEITILKNEKEIQTEKLESHQTKQIIYILIVCTLCIVVFLVFRLYQSKKQSNKLLLLQQDQISHKNQQLTQANALLSQQKEEIEAQRDEIEVQSKYLQHINQILEFKNKNIIDSINNAKRLQDAVLPSLQVLSEFPLEYFVIFMPKDIVSGDFYYFNTCNQSLVIAAADCTGHGVSGAFMSILGITILNKIINEEKINKPEKILNQLHYHLSKALQQNNAKLKVNDGIDISLCNINFKEKKLEFSGAINSLYHIRNNQLFVLKGDIIPIGYRDEDTSYQVQCIELLPNDCIYLFSDGYSDQFGGENKRKFLTKNFKNLLLNCQNLPLTEQKQFLENTFTQWKGALEQVDDILIIGLKV